MEEMKTIILKYSKMTNEQLDKIKETKTNKFMWETEALELGLIDEII